MCILISHSPHHKQSKKTNYGGKYLQHLWQSKYPNVRRETTNQCGKGKHLGRKMNQEHNLQRKRFKQLLNLKYPTLFIIKKQKKKVRVLLLIHLIDKDFFYKLQQYSAGGKGDKNWELKHNWWKYKLAQYFEKMDMIHIKKL